MFVHCEYVFIGYYLCTVFDSAYNKADCLYLQYAHTQAQAKMQL